MDEETIAEVPQPEPQPEPETLTAIDMPRKIRINRRTTSLTCDLCPDLIESDYTELRIGCQTWKAHDHCLERLALRILKSL